jgi:hypothetical protein
MPRFRPGLHAKLRRNPRKGLVEVYDPSLEQMRAVQQGMYESAVKKTLNLPYNSGFRDRDGQRLDMLALMSAGRRKADAREVLRGIAKTSMFQQGISTAIRQGVVSREAVQKQDGSWTTALLPTRDGAQKAKLRYSGQGVNTYTHLVQNRQDYEETLALSRKDGNWFRVTAERVGTATKFCVWPLPTGRYTPLVFASQKTAEDYADELNDWHDIDNPGCWWVPQRGELSRSDVQHWLPSDGAFFGGGGSAAAAVRPRKKSAKRNGRLQLV